jgi:hypothetical protein
MFINILKTIFNSIISYFQEMVRKVEIKEEPRITKDCRKKILKKIFKLKRKLKIIFLRDKELKLDELPLFNFDYF